MDATMQDVPLTITQMFEHGRRVQGSSKVLTFDGSGLRSRTYAEVGDRAERLAVALRELGVRPGDRVGTFMWNTDEHLEAYFAVPCMGAVLHTLNLRLHPDQLTHVINEAADRVVLVHATVLPLLARVAAALRTVEHYVVVNDLPAGTPPPEIDPVAALAATGARVHGYEQLLEAGIGGFTWPELDERSAAAMCYTSGTTGDPRGVVYSHRSTFLHSFGVNNSGLYFGQRDRGLLVVPMFHVMAWGFPYTAWINGSDIVMPARFLQGGPLATLIELAGVTVSAGVPTIWAQVLAYVDEHPEVDLSSLRLLMSGGAPLPRAIVERFDALGVRMIQGWGMTETSPLCAIGEPPKDVDPWDVAARLRTGRVAPGVELRIVDRDGAVAPWDGVAEGEIEVRGPWITASYFGASSGDDAARFHDGWLRTGDIASVDPNGSLMISDRVKDVVKSGGEWISSVDLENEIMGHPAVAEAMVVGVPDPRWGERPLAVVALRPGAEAGPDELRGWLEERVARWWLPEQWAFVDELPKTSVGKFDKKAVRARHAEGSLPVVAVAAPA
jgi:fatty-acyl-CoA synthase